MAVLTALSFIKNDLDLTPIDITDASLQGYNLVVADKLWQ